MLAEFELRWFLTAVLLAVFVCYKRRLVDLPEGVFVLAAVFCLSLVPLPSSDGGPLADCRDETPPATTETSRIDQLELEPPPTLDDLRKVTVRKPVETPDPDSVEREPAASETLTTDSEPAADYSPATLPPRAAFAHSRLTEALDDSRGDPLLLYFTWQTGCPPCEQVAKNVLSQEGVQAELAKYSSAKIIVNQNQPWLDDADELAFFTRSDSGAQRGRIAVPYAVVYDPSTGGVAAFNPGNYTSDAVGFLNALETARQQAAAAETTWAPQRLQQQARTK